MGWNENGCQHLLDWFILCFVKTQGTGIARLLRKKQEDILQYKNPGTNLILMGDFIARDGNLIDYIDIYDEDEQLPPRFNKDSKIITNGRLLID